jgi:hypothetical protein
VTEARIRRTLDKAQRGELLPPIGYSAATARSTGKPCCGCDESIEAGELVYFATLRRAVLLRFHDVCFATWAEFKS